MRHSHLTEPFWAAALTLLMAAALALAACGGSSTTSSTSPSMTGSALVEEAATPIATPLPAPTVAGTIAIGRIADEAKNGDTCVTTPNGTGLRRLVGGPGWTSPSPFSPDGKRKIVYELGPATGTLKYFRVWVMNADGSGKAPLANSGGAPSWSPDGKRIAFSRYVDEETRAVMVMNADGSGIRSVVKEPPAGSRGFEDPAWTPDGKPSTATAGTCLRSTPTGAVANG